MSKNIVIGILVIIIIFGFGYWIYHTGAPNASYENPTTVATTTATNPSTTTSSPTPTPVASAPKVVTSTSVVVSNSTASITGSIVPNGAQTTYWFEYGETTALGTRTSVQSAGSGYATVGTPGYITGLKANTKYYYRLSGQNRLAIVNGATYSFTTNNNPPPLGSAPSSHTDAATGIDRTVAKLNGHLTPNGSETTYWFEWGTDTNFGFTSSFQSASNGNSSINVSDSLSNLEPLTKYYFRLNAQNQFGTVNGATLSFTTKGPPAPTTPIVTTTNASNVASTSATMNGRINPNGAETTYWFEYSQDSALESLLGTVTASQTIAAGNATTSVALNASGLDPHTIYYYRLVAQNQYGTTRGSAVSFTTKSQ